MGSSKKSDTATALRDLFDAVVQIEPNRRSAFLDEACHDDAVRREVESLLASHDRRAPDVRSALQRLPFSPAPPSSAVTPEELLGWSGKTISHYHILEEIGSGGMGVVYKARNLKLDRFAALKFMPLHMRSNAAARERFLQEARAAYALDHSNICTIYDIGETDNGVPFIAMAYYDGESLKERLNRGPLSIDEAVVITQQIGAGLSAAHENGIVHRDLKPGNVMITRSGVVKLLDFGVAKVSGSDITGSGMALGTTAYMSPEQIRGQNVDARSDIWSLGICLYEMLTGRHPFVGDYDIAIVYSVLHTDPVPVAELIPNLPTDLAHIVDCCLQKDPDKRYASARTVLGDLRSVRSEVRTSESLRTEAGPGSGIPETHESSQNGMKVFPQPSSSAQLENLELPEGTMDPESRFYVRRPADDVAERVITRQGITLTIKGSRQMGKSSLLLRTLSAARAAGKRVVLLDCQLFGQNALANADLFFRQFASWLSLKLLVPNRVEEYWQVPLGNSQCCSLYMEDVVLGSTTESIVLAMDEVERIFDTDFRSDFFSMLRSWHNSRATSPLWKRLDLALVTSTEPYQLIDNLNQSPFNVGEILELNDFTREQVWELNSRHGNPLDENQIDRLMELLGGHPYLTRRALYLVVTGRSSFDDLLKQAADDNGPFGDHLRHHLFRLHGHEELIAGLRSILRQRRCDNEEVLWRLHGAGLVLKRGREAVPRNRLYWEYFKEHFDG